MHPLPLHPFPSPSPRPCPILPMRSQGGAWAPNIWERPWHAAPAPTAAQPPREQRNPFPLLIPAKNYPKSPPTTPSKKIQPCDLRESWLNSLLSHPMLLH